ncbi:MAG: ABC transporter ATP-binding protein [Rhodanobacter sp.]|nr:MAG: ABC transporter ATP-binding protein [Rhodanobacter sp.]TAM00558.1 MAG: ABC transporter ATP-binding protein [Rhodanobacter sp.]TAM42950.1 MAG: ABC transporter ATP-binding protein [Rhodanobacter sp.]TAN25598.1 MAG: ABC transporter ATP-binding protein [Rhodanobacter sp.]
MHSEGESTREAAPDPAPSSSGLLQEIGQLGRAVKRLFGAQMELLAAELGLARSAISWMLLAGLTATVAGVGFGLTVLSLVGVLLVKWLGSWVWALLVLAVLQLLFLLGAIALFRRCMHWMSLPATRGEWSAIMRDAEHKAEAAMAAESVPAQRREDQHNEDRR